MADVLHDPVSDSRKMAAAISITEKIDETDALCKAKSCILIKTAAGNFIEAGFKIKQGETGLRIVDLDFQNHIVSNLELMEDDKLLAINNVDVSCWKHHEVVDCLQKIFDPERSRLSIVIERKQWTEGEEETVKTLEIEVEYLIPRGGIGACITLLKKTTFLSKFLGVPAVYCMEYKGAKECLIAIDTQLSQKLYLKCGTDGKLTMSNLPSRTDSSFHFKKIIFHGFQKQHGKNHSCFPCVLQSVDTEMFVSVNIWSSVHLASCPDGSEDVASKTSVQRADHRFFFMELRNTKQGSEYMFESSIFKGMFLTWDSTKKKLKLSDSVADSSVVHSASQSTFHIYSL